MSDKTEELKADAEAVKDRLEEFREKHPRLDHVIRTVQHYGKVKGNNQAGAVTYFGFLSFFPILALAFFTVGIVAQVYPDARTDLTEAIDGVLPGIIGEDSGQIPLSSVQGAAGAAGVIGLLGVLYSGLGWLSALQSALLVVFELPEKRHPNFVIGMLRSLATLAIIGFTLIVSVSISGAVTGFSRDLLRLVGLGAELGWVLAIVSVLIGLAANMVLFFVIFKLLAQPVIPPAALWSGALLGAIGFEALKWASSFLIGLTKGQPAFQAFGIALILLVWINYFSRVVMYAASWAHTSPIARAARGELDTALPDAANSTGSVALAKPGRIPPSTPRPAVPRTEDEKPAGAWFLGGAAAMWALIAVIRRRPK
jgi:membrane protein